MALPPLCTLEDLAAYGVTINPDEQTQVRAFLDAASAAVRDAAGCPISQVVDDTVSLIGHPDCYLVLPGPPVTAVSAVAVDGHPVTDYRLVGDRLWRACGWQPTVPCEVTVTYTHGLPEVPADLVILVGRLALAVLADARAEPDGTGLAAADIRAERIADYSVTYGSDGSVTELELSDRLRERIAARFGGIGTVGLVRSR